MITTDHSIVVGQQRLARLSDQLPGPHLAALAAENPSNWNELIRVALESTTFEDPTWPATAAVLLCDELLSTAQYPYNDEEFVSHLRRLSELGLYDHRLLSNYSVDQLTEAGTWIRPDRDHMITYSGLKLLSERYLLRHQGILQELPQHRFLVIALFLALAYPEKPMRWARQFYDALSQLELTVATPVLANAGKAQGQLASCYVDTVADSLWSIYQTNQAFAQVSKHGGGMGIYLGHARAKGSAIREVSGAAGGVIAWVQAYNNTATAVDQLGVRAGAVSVWLDIWHADILDFLELKTNNGDPRMKAHDVFPGVSIPDAFMRAVQDRAPWYLLDPHSVYQATGWRLEDSWGEEWETRYQQCVRDPSIPKQTVPARDLMKLLMRSSFETGTPFVFFRDTVNQANPNRHQGIIYATNLCTEIAQNMRPSQAADQQLDANGMITSSRQAGDFVVCNLASLNLGRLPDPESLMQAARTAVRLMDAAIDLNCYPLPEAQYTAHQYRAVGLGVSGYAQRLAQERIAWESDDHLCQADQWFEDIAFAAIDESANLAALRGSYPLFEGSAWQTGEYFRSHGYQSPRWLQLQSKISASGLRNGYLLAIAPTSSTSLIAGTTAGIDPVFQPIFWEEKRSGLVPEVAPDLSSDTLAYYPSAYDVDPTWILRAAAVRGRHLDQSQSLNLYITSETTASQFLDYYLTAWELKIKTLYYVRNRSLDAIACVGCSN